MAVKNTEANPQQGSAKLIVKDLQLLTVVDNNNQEVRNQAEIPMPFPASYIVRTANILLVNIQSTNPQGTCWAMFNGRWYNYTC